MLEKIKAYTLEHKVFFRLLIQLISVFISVGLIIQVISSLLPHKTQPVSIVATPAPVVKAEPKIEVMPTKPIKVYKHSAKIKQKVKLPQPVIDNPSEQVLAATKVESNDHPQLVTTVLNTDTGETSTYIKQEPQPWFATNTHGDFSTYVGFKNRNTAIRFQVRQNLIDVKSVHINAVGSVDQSTNGDTDYFVGIGATYAW